MRTQTLKIHAHRTRNPEARLLVFVAVSALVLTLGMIGIFGWLEYGNGLLVSLLQSGLAWCL